MNITVIGMGYVGIVTALVYSRLGHQVIGVDIDTERINMLSKGESPIYERDLDKELKAQTQNQRLKFSVEPNGAIVDADLVFICVGTPSLEDGTADLTQVKKVSSIIGNIACHNVIVINKSTVPVGTAEHIRQWIQKRIHEKGRDISVDVASLPEFLREGRALQDALNPDRIVIGTESEDTARLLRELHTPLGAPTIITNTRTAEMIKYCSNAFLATKISFINEIANICENIGVDVVDVARGIGMDKRIGNTFLTAGVGYGGSCFPKDTRALVQIAGRVKYDFKLLKAVIEVNQLQRLRVINTITGLYAGELCDKRIAILGLTFKPNTDDVREAPALDIINRLTILGATVVATDPKGLRQARRSVPEVELVDDPYVATKGADVVVLLTEWNEYIELDWARVILQMKGNTVIDGRNALDPTLIKELGGRYVGIGRGLFVQSDNHSLGLINTI